MPAARMAVAEREPRRARYLIPRDAPQRGEVVAALTILALVGHLLFAQLTLLLAIVFHIISRTSRWRPQWLTVPAGVGLLWVLAIGPPAALAGFTAGPSRVAGYLARTAHHPSNVFHLGEVFGGLGHWLPRQLPLALIAAAGEAAAACWLRWLHTAEPDLLPPRPGLMILAGRQLRISSVRAGGVVTREGACLGIVRGTGQRAAISWPEAEGGVLCTGSSEPGVAATSFQVVHAAIRRRKPVIAVDLAGTPGLAESLKVVCEAAGAPLHIFGPSGPGFYEPLRGGDPARKAALVMGMIDWGAVADYARRTCGGYLNDLFAVAAAAPGDPGIPVLDDVVHLLSPAALRARVERVPAYHPRRGPLAERVRVSASLLQVDPAPAAVLAEQLTGLRASPLGRWLRPEPSSGRAAGSARITLSGIVRDRAVVLFSLDQAAGGRSAVMIANLVALDTTAVFAEARRREVGGDGLAWLGHCDAVDHPALTGLIGTGAQAGLASLLGTVSPEAAARIAGLVNVLVIHRLDDPGLAARLASLASAAPHPGRPGPVAAGGPAGHGALSVPPAPGARAVPGALAVPAALAAPGALHAPTGFSTAQVPAVDPPPGHDPWMTGPGEGPAGPSLAGAPLVSAAALCDLRQDEFALAVKRPVRRVVPVGRFISGGTPVTAAPFRADRVYLGWQYALVHPDPGPPPRRPVPPEQEQVNQGWVAAQRREENLLSRPLKLAVGCCLALAALVVALAVAGILNAALTSLVLAVFLALAAVSGRAIWRGEEELRGTVEQEKRRVARARAAAESRLFGWQDEHARMFRDWQARERAFGGQLQWYAVALPDEIDRVDVAGGTLSGWSAMLTMVAGPRLAAGGQVTVLDLSEGAVAQDLLAVARGSGIDPLVWVLPADLPGFDLGAGLPREALADVLAMSVATSGDRAGPPDTSHDYAILDRILEAIGGEASIAQVTAGLRALAQVGDPREDISHGLITAVQLEQITGLYGRGAADRVVTERAWALEAKLRKLETLGSAPVPLPQSRLRVIAMDRTGGVAGNTVLGTYVTVALTHVLRGAPPGPPWQHTLCLAGAEKLRGDVLDRLCDACEATRTGLVLAYRSLPGHVKERLGRGNAAVAFMRLGNAEDAKAASEQIGTEHRFVLTQLTDTVGTSVTDTAGDSYTSTVAAADSVSMSASTSETRGRSRGSGHSRAGSGPFGQSTRSGSRDSSHSWGTSDTESITEGITLSTAWGVNTSKAIGANSSLARTTQRSREFLIEQHELQQLPPSAVIVSYASRGGRRVVLADANPGLLALPTATLHTLEEVRDAAPMAPGPMLAGGAGRPGATWEPAAAGGAGTTGVPAGFGARGGRGGAAAENAASGPAAGAGAGAGSAGAGDGGGGGGAVAGGPGAAGRPGPAAPRHGVPGGPRVPAGTGPVPPPTRDPAAAPISWRDAEEKPPPNLGPPPEPLDWRKRRK